MCKRKLVSLVICGLIGLLISAQAAAEEAAPSPGDDVEDRTWTVAVIADLNGPYGSTEYNEHVTAAVEWISEELQPDLVLSAGDMVAGQRAGLNYSVMWNAFHTVVSDPLADAGIPLAVTPGNHDASEQPAFWEERIEFARQWKVRRPQLAFVDDANYPFYYAFEMGPALFISLDGTGVGDLDKGQVAWIDDVLERHSHLEVSILFSHVPQYPAAQGREHEIFADEALAEVMSKHGVDMKISGHHHAYFPGWRQGTFFLHAGLLGSGPRALIGEDHRSQRSVAVVQFNEEGIIDIDAYESPDFSEAIDRDELPEQLGDGELRLYRDDARADEPDDEEPES